MNLIELENFLTIEEKENYLEYAKLLKYEEGTNNRVFCVNKEIAESFSEKIKDSVPQIEGYKFSNVSPSFRIYSYSNPDHLFPPHEDTTYEFAGKQCLMSLVVYLNDDFEGGETIFAEGLKILPKAGKALLFIAKGNIHEGLAVTSGIKYVMKCDVMFEKV